MTSEQNKKRLLVVVVIVAVVIAVSWYLIRRSMQKFAFPIHQNANDCYNFLNAIGSPYYQVPLDAINSGYPSIPSMHENGSECLDYWTTYAQEEQDIQAVTGGIPL